MQPSEVRARVREEHADLRARLSHLERMAMDLLRGHATADALRREGCRLHEVLCTHLEWEDVHLAPVLRGGGPGGLAHSARLAREHHEQRELLSYVLERLRDAARPPIVLARDLLAFVELLRHDMADEERALLGEDALADPEAGVPPASRLPGEENDQPGT